MSLNAISDGSLKDTKSLHPGPRNKQKYAWLVLLAIAACCSYGPLLVEHGKHLWSCDHFQFFPILVLSTACVVFSCVRESLRSNPDRLAPKRWRVEPVAFFFSLLLLPIAADLNSPWLAACSFLCLGDSLLNRFPVARQSWRVLFVLIPLPLGYDSRLLHEMQIISSTYASSLLDLMGVFHIMQGNVLELDSRQFFVAEACTGLTSIYLIMAGTWFSAAFLQLRLIRAVPLILSSIWWSVVANIVRIVVIAFAHHQWRLDLATGIAHEVTGLAVMGTAFVLILMTKQVIDFVFDPVVSDGRNPDDDLRQRLTPAIVWNLYTDPHMRSENNAASLPLGMEVNLQTLLRFSTLTLLLSCGIYVVSTKSNLLHALLGIVWRSV